MKRNIVIALALTSLIFIISCGSGSNKISDDELSGFMLSGIYTINGFGGQVQIDNHVKENAGNNKEKIVSSYRDILIFPYPTGDSDNARQTLSESWSVTNKYELKKTLKDLENGTLSNFKAWNYARYVNNVNLGYAAGFLTREEGLELIKNIQMQAKDSYKTWDDYFNDFVAGRKDWNKNSLEEAQFEALAKSMLAGVNSIYKLLPLNSSK